MGMGMMPTKNKGACFCLSTQYVGGDIQKLLANLPPSIIMSSKMDSNGTLEAVCVKNLTENIMLRLTGQFPNGNDLTYA